MDNEQGLDIEVKHCYVPRIWWDELLKALNEVVEDTRLYYGDDVRGRVDAIIYDAESRMNNAKT